MDFAIPPYTDGPESIAMEATVATDDQFDVEYRFLGTAPGQPDHVSLPRLSMRKLDGTGSGSYCPTT